MLVFCYSCNRYATEIIVTVQGEAVYRCSCGSNWEQGSAARPVGTIYFYSEGKFYSLAPGAKERPQIVKNADSLRFCRKALDDARSRHSVGSLSEAMEG